MTNEYSEFRPLNNIPGCEPDEKWTDTPPEGDGWYFEFRPSRVGTTILNGDGEQVEVRAREGKPVYSPMCRVGKVVHVGLPEELE